MLNKFQRTYRDLHPIKLNVYKSDCCDSDLLDGGQCENCGAAGVEFSSDYPLGNSLEPYDIEKEKIN